MVPTKEPAQLVEHTRPQTVRGALGDPLTELGGRPHSKGEGDDGRRCNPVSEQVGNPLGHDLRLA